MTRTEKNLVKKSIKKLSYLSIIMMLVGFSLIFMGLGGLGYKPMTESIGVMIIIGIALGFVIAIVALLLSAKSAEKQRLISRYRLILIGKKETYYFGRVRFYVDNDEVFKAFEYLDLMKISTTKYIAIGYIMKKCYDMRGSLDAVKVSDLLAKYLN